MNLLKNLIISQFVEAKLNLTTNLLNLLSSNKNLSIMTLNYPKILLFYVNHIINLMYTLNF